MKRMITCLLAFSLLLGCQKDDDDDDNITVPEGMFIGTFNRTGMDTASVTLTLDGNKFNGQSDMAKYPAICHGSFEINDNTIVFSDSCAWTANFDWSLILNGSYTFSRNNNELRFSRTNGTITDEYILSRISR
jgi:hypothetical protein